jgi:hypothetical protein
MEKVFKKIQLNDEWVEVSLGMFNDFYIIAERCKKSSKSDTVDKDNVKKIRFEIGMDSLSKKKPLTINYLTLDFSSMSSSDEETNNKTALLKVLNYPSKFYIKPIELTLADNNLTVKEGKTSIEVGINALKLN